MVVPSGAFRLGEAVVRLNGLKLPRKGVRLVELLVLRSGVLGGVSIA